MECFLAETVYGRDPVRIHVCTGACGVVEPAVLGGDILPGRAETDPPVVRSQV